MIQTLNELDTRLFVWLNNLNAPWLDPVMIAFTERNTWIPLYVLLIGWLVYQFRRQTLGLLLVIAGSVGVADQVSSSVLKPLTHRLRPCHTPTLDRLIHPVMECGGLYSFVSSHAATTFALATSLWLLLGRRYPAVGLFFLWAALVSYSRIYVAAHYPLDVLAGTGIGVFSATLLVTLYRRTTHGRRLVELGR